MKKLTIVLSLTVVSSALKAEMISLTQCYSLVSLSPNNIMGEDRLVIPGTVSSKLLSGGSKEVLVLSATSIDERDARKATEKSNQELTENHRIEKIVMLGCTTSDLK